MEHSKPSVPHATARPRESIEVAISRANTPDHNKDRAAYIDRALLLRVTPLRTASNGQADFEDLIILLSLIKGVGLLQLELQVLQGLRLRLQGQSETDESKQKQQYFSHEKRLNK